MQKEIVDAKNRVSHTGLSQICFEHTEDMDEEPDNNLKTTRITKDSISRLSRSKYPEKVFFGNYP